MKWFVGLSLVIIVGFVLISPSLACIRFPENYGVEGIERIFIYPEKNEMIIDISNEVELPIGQNINRENTNASWGVDLDPIIITRKNIDQVVSYSCFGYIKNNNNTYNQISCNRRNNSLYFTTILKNHISQDGESYKIRINVKYLIKNVGDEIYLDDELGFNPKAYVINFKLRCKNIAHTEIFFEKKFIPKHIPNNCEVQYSKNRTMFYLICEPNKTSTLILNYPSNYKYNVLLWAFSGAILGFIIEWLWVKISKRKQTKSELAI